jgi:hypothetical protein
MQRSQKENGGQVFQPALDDVKEFSPAAKAVNQPDSSTPSKIRPLQKISGWQINRVVIRNSLCRHMRFTLVARNATESIPY